MTNDPVMPTMPNAQSSPDPRPAATGAGPSPSLILQAAFFIWCALAITVVGLVAGISRGDFAGNATTAVFASPDARIELSQTVADEITDAEPLAALIPQLDRWILAGIESPERAPAYSKLVKHGIATRLGQSDGPLLLDPNDVIVSSNPIVTLGVTELPDIPIGAADRSPASASSIVHIGAVATIISSALAYVAARIRWGRARSAVLTGAAGMLAAIMLLALPTTLILFNEPLSSAVAGAAVRPTAVAAIACIGAAVTIRGFIANCGWLPYRQGDAITLLGAG